MHGQILHVGLALQLFPGNVGKRNRRQAFPRPTGAHHDFTLRHHARTHPNGQRLILVRHDNGYRPGSEGNVGYMQVVASCSGGSKSERTLAIRKRTGPWLRRPRDEKLQCGARNALASLVNHPAEKTAFWSRCKNRRGVCHRSAPHQEQAQCKSDRKTRRHDETRKDE